MDDQIIEYSISDLVRNIMGAFTTTPLEAVLIAAGIVLLVTGSILFVVFNRRRQKRLRLRRVEHVFQDILHDFHFTPEETEALQLLGRHVTGGLKYKYRVLTSRKSFDEAVKNAQRENPLPEQIVEQVRKKLAFCCFEDPETVTDTRELPEGTPMYIITEDQEGFHGTMEVNDPSGPIVRIGRIDAFESKARQVKVQYRQGKQIFQFTTTARKQHSGTLLLEHTDELSRLERRDYFRVRRKMFVKLRKEGDKHLHDAKLLDIGGGGASIENPAGILKKGDVVRLILDLPKTGELPVTARVVRTSREETTAHLHFENILEGTRDKIISFVLREEF